MVLTQSGSLFWEFVFYATFGHAAESWDDPRVQKLYVEAVKWALHLTD